MTSREFARRLDVETETVRRWVRARKIRPAGRTPGGQLRFDEAQVAQVLAGSLRSPRAREIETHVASAFARLRRERRSG